MELRTTASSNASSAHSLPDEDRNLNDADAVTLLGKRHRIADLEKTISLHGRSIGLHKAFYMSCRRCFEAVTGKSRQVTEEEAKGLLEWAQLDDEQN